MAAAMNTHRLLPSWLSLVCRVAVVVVCMGSVSAHAMPRVASPMLVAPPLEGQLNVNDATAEQWDLLPGVGPTTAARILAFVQRRALSHTSQLMRVKGIGRKTYERMKPYLVLTGTTTLRVAEPSEPEPPSQPPVEPTGG
jgi:competence protein ComEA